MPDVYANWDKAKYLCEKLGGYLPSVEELKVMAKYIKEFNQFFEENDRIVCLLDTNYTYWSSSEYSSSRARCVLTYNGVVGDDNKNYGNYVRTFRCA